MKVFFFMGRNPANRSGLSWKIWKINRTGRRVSTFWGPATLQRRRAAFASSPQSRRRRFETLEAARLFEESKIREKLRAGYQRRTRWR